MEDKILELLKDSQETMNSVKIKIEDNEVNIQVLAFDKMDALGKKGGVLSFFIE